MRFRHDLAFDEFAPDSIASEREADYLELPLSGRVFVFAVILVIVVAALVFARIAYLNIGRGDFYAGRSEANINREIAVPAYRGLITDRYGTVLATNAETFSVHLDTPALLKDRRRLDATLVSLSQVIGQSVEELYGIFESADFENKNTVVVARNISAEQAIAVRGLELSDVRVENDYRREYSNGEVFSHVIGYTGVGEKGSAIIGKAGLERSYDEALRGSEGVKIEHKDAQGKTIDERIVATPVSGYQLTTTIDADLQTFFYNRLRTGLRQLGLSAGVGIAIDPRNGEVLSLISIPSFNNELFVTPGSGKELSALFTNTNRPLFNRSVSGTYNPASTIKPLVAVAALAEGVADVTTSILSTGYIELPNPFNPDKPSRFVDWKAHGWVNVHSALARSSNVYFYEVGGGFETQKGLGIKKLHEYWRQFGLGTKTGIDLDFEAEGLLPTAEEKEERTGQPWRIGDTYNVSIGQGDLLVTPLQLVNYIATIAANGTRYQPRLMKELKDSEGALMSESKPVIIQEYPELEGEIFEVQKGMKDAASKEYGTAWLLHELPMRVAAKTGSAQTNNNTKTNALFVGYAPADDPQLAILVLVENAKEGSLNTIPIVRDIFNWYYENRLSQEKNARP